MMWPKKKVWLNTNNLAKTYKKKVEISKELYILSNFYVL